MGDPKLMDTSQIINGIAVLLSFFVGYKYALKRNGPSKEQGEEAAAAGSTNKTDERKGAEANEPLFTSIGSTYKMVLVVRNDLKMGKGKVAAQCAHGAVGAFQKAAWRIPSVVAEWENTGCAKIALKVESEAEMMAIKRAADVRALNTCLIRDAGRTQIEPNTKTVLAIGPATVEAIDQVTGHLKLL